MVDFEKLQISDDDINRILNPEIRRAEDWAEQLSEERERCDSLYHREPLGNEEDGFSHYVQSTVFDTVNWLLPGLVDIFTNEDFFSIKMDDSEKAERIKRMIRFQLMNQQTGAKEIRQFVFACLKYHNGTLKVFYDEQYHEETEEYDQLSVAEFQNVENAERNGKLTISRYNEITDTTEGLTTTFYKDVKVVHKIYDYKGPRLEAVPPWEFLITPGVASVEESPFVCHRKRSSLDEIARGERTGLYRKGVAKLAAEKGYNDLTVPDLREEREQQYEYDDIDLTALDEYNDNLPSDPMTEPNRVVYIDEIYTRLDIDGDGVTEPVIVWKTGDVVLNVTENPYGRPPFRECAIFEDIARREGKALPLLLREDQIEATNLQRIFVDAAAESAYGTMISNDPEFLELWSNRSVGDSILATRYGEPGRTYNVERPDQPGQTLIKAIEMIRMDHERRTGVNSLNQGLSADNIGKTATGTIALQNAGQQRQKLYATIIGETLRNVIRDFIWINRVWRPTDDLLVLGEEAFSFDPEDLDGDADVQVEVGVGPNDRIAKAQQLEGHFAKLVQALIPAGAAGPEHLIKTAARIGKMYGQNIDDLMFSDQEINTIQGMQQQIQQLTMQLQQIQQGMQGMGGQAPPGPQEQPIPEQLPIQAQA